MKQDEFNVTKIEDYIWHRQSDEVLRKEWDDYSDDLLYKNTARYWEDLEEYVLQEADRVGEEMLKRYGVWENFLESCK